MADSTLEQTVKTTPRRGRLVFVVPIAAIVGLMVLLGIGLTLKPRDIPSPLIGKAVPEFTLPPVLGRALGMSSADLKGGVSLVNVFASWCTACRVEHPLLMRLNEQGTVPIHGPNYKDAPNDAAEWLDALGDPYTRTGADIDGRVGIEWGVYGVPETFGIDRHGQIAYKHIGPISESDWRDTLLPLVQRLRKP